MRDIARREGRVGVVVTLAVEPERPGTWNPRTVARAQRELVDTLRPGVRVVGRVEEFPRITLRVTPGALRRLRAYPLVAEISLNQAP